jgi:hypothetical protein
MLLTLRVTEERKRISSVATHRVPHIDIDTSQLAAAFTPRPTATRNLGLLTEEL